MRILPLFLFLSGLLNAFDLCAAQTQDTVRVADFGVHPYSYENCVSQLQAAVDQCKRQGAKVLLFEKGRYDLWPEYAARRELFVTNTSTEQECPSKVKTIGLLLEELEDLTVEGNGATLMCHGKMTMIALIHCNNIRLHNLHIDFERPGGTELTYTQADGQGVEVAFHRDARYEIADGRIHLYGEGWRSNRNHCIEYDPSSERFFYSNGWNTLAGAQATEIAPGKVRFRTPADFRPKVGNTLTVRDIIRDQVGVLTYESRDITFDHIGVHYMHGLGMVSQYSRNVTMTHVHCTPREGSGRILASSADFMHFSGCSGKVTVTDCRFAGAQDDPINVHGTNLRAIARPDRQTLRLRFMHGQSYGYNAYFEGDTVSFVRAATMERISEARVSSVRRLTDREVEVTFDRPVPEHLELNHDCVENLTCTPEVEIRRCHFTRTSTRGTLVTTPRKVVIADNTYYKTGMSAILIEGDAEGWYESGPVKDVLIENNTFVECAYSGGPSNAVIALHPSNTQIDANRPVHRNIRIVGNKFTTFGNPVLYAKSSEGVSFIQNKVDCRTADAAPAKPMFILNGCKNVRIKLNQIEHCTPVIDCRNMKKGYVKTDL